MRASRRHQTTPSPVTNTHIYTSVCFASTLSVDCLLFLLISRKYYSYYKIFFFSYKHACHYFSPFYTVTTLQMHSLLCIHARGFQRGPHRTTVKAQPQFSPYATSPTICIWNHARTACDCIWSETAPLKCCQ